MLVQLARSMNKQSMLFANERTIQSGFARTWQVQIKYIHGSSGILIFDQW
jgi:hypothetical protein